MKAGQAWTLLGLTFIATEALVFHLYGRKYNTKKFYCAKNLSKVGADALPLSRRSFESYVKAKVKTE